MANKNSKAGNDKNEKAESKTDNDVKAAHEQADKDILKDPDLSIHSPNDDLDEGETARLGEGKNDLV